MAIAYRIALPPLGNFNLSNERAGSGTGSDAADAEYREKLADKIAEAIVDYRYGDGVYQRQPAFLARAGGGGGSFLPSFR